MDTMILSIEGKKALDSLTENEKEKALEILKVINGMEVARADKILIFCREAAKCTAVTDTQNLFIS